MFITPQEEMKKLEGSIQFDQIPKLENKAALALFYKQSVNGQILYTNVQEGKIHSFLAENIDKLHQNNAYELLFVLSGSMINKIEDKEYHYQAGQGCLFNRQIAHSELLHNGHVLFLNISHNILKEILTGLGSSDKQGTLFQFLQSDLKQTDNWQRRYLEFTPTTPLKNQHFAKLLDALQIELATNKIGAQYFQKGLLLRIFSELENAEQFKINTVNIDISKEEFLVSRVISLIEANYGNISRKQIEQQLHYNAEYLNRLLKKHCQHTIITFAKSIRTKKAKQLLHTTDMTVAEVAQVLGFSSENYFYHYFKNETQLSPKQYRTKKVQEN